MSPWQLRRASVGLLGISVLMLSVPARADISPPVKIKMPPDTKPAASGQEYAGVFEVHVARAGTLANFRLAGEGWTILAAELPAAPMAAEPGVLRIPFTAIPADADVPISLNLTWNGRRVHRAYQIGATSFARAGQTRRSVCVREGTAGRPGITRPAPDADGARDSDGRGGRKSLSFEGRIVYTRPCQSRPDPDDPNNPPPDADCDDPWDIPERIVGADRIYFEVWDNDPVGHVTICWGYTDVNGYFATGTVDCEDCDEEPDLILYYDTDTGVVDVTDASVYENTYEFKSDEITDFTGTHYNFGLHTPEDTGLHPALHILNSVTRAHRFILSRAEYDLPEVQVIWPHDDTAYSPDWVEIHVDSDHTWREDAHTHEFGHHFMHSYSDPPESDYCNPGDYCDEDPAEEECGHCWWCPENEHVAWNEGLPNWLADVVTRSYPLDYVFDDSSAFYPLYTLDLESEGSNTECPGVREPLTTEGFVGMLLRDIEDDGQDDHNGDGIRDSLCLGAEPILDTQVNNDPITVLEFISAFRTRYPQLDDRLWPTARNVAAPYVTGFPDDTGPPGAVTWADSSSHPLGGFGVLPCIEVEWEPADDDVMGANAYSYVWSTNPAGVQPDTTEDPVDFAPCRPAAVSPPLYLGDHYFSIRARDAGGDWSTEYATFGPFVIGECNNNGIMDICEIACNQSAAPLACTPDPNFCNVPGCGTAPDCNGNLVPDACDIASGFSADCNLNGIPDECENMYHWGAGSGWWHVPGNWLEGATPTTDSEVCIDVPGEVTVEYSLGTLQIATLACSESLAIEGATGSRTFTITEPSFVLGNLRLKNNDTMLQVDDRLDISGLFEWTGSNVSNSAKLKGPGVTYANGGVQISDVVRLDGHRLVLDGNSTSVTTTGRVDFTGPAVFEIRPGSTYEHQGSGGIFGGWTSDRFVNGGALIKSVDPGSSNIYMFTENNGLIHVQAGTLKFYLYGSSTGDFLADPGTTLHFVDGGFTFYAGSSVVAETVIFGPGAGGWNTVSGTYDVSGSTTVSAGQVTFANGANIVSFGPSFYISRSTVNFDTPIGGPIQFDTLSVGPGASSDGIANFNSGDPVQATNLLIGPGSITGPGDITVNGLMTWNGGGSIVGPGTINVDGDLLVNAGGSQKMLSNRTLNNAATATFLGGFGRSSAVVNNLPTGVMDFQADVGVLTGYAQPLNNAGTMVKSAGPGTSTIHAAMNNTGTVEVQTGVLSFYTGYGGSYVQTAGQTVLNGGDLLMSGPASLQINGGLLTGAGTVTGNVVNSAGTLAPGLPIGQMNIVGTYTQQAGAGLDIELSDTAPGAFDKLACTGNVALAGNLAVTFVPPFEPSHGDSFIVVVSGATLGGTFAGVSATNLPLTMILGVDYSGNAVKLTVIGGDCDSDGALDIDDFAAFGGCLQGPNNGVNPDCDCLDLDKDGDVDLADFATFQAWFDG